MESANHQKWIDSNLIEPDRAGLSLHWPDVFHLSINVKDIWRIFSSTNYGLLFSIKGGCGSEFYRICEQGTSPCRNLGTQTKLKI